jgi:raffinose/stachyose/melibiose transport system permease protein
MNNKRGIWPVIAILPVTIIFILFSIFPAIMNIYYSFTDFTGNLDTKVNWIGLTNYIRAFTLLSDDIYASIKNTLIFSFSITILLNIVALLVAILVDMKLKIRDFYRSVIFLPTILGPVVIGLVWTLILDPYNGPVNKFLNLFGNDSALLGDPKAALMLVILVMIWANYGYTMVLYLAGLQKIPVDLYESGYIDGAFGFKRFWYITLPLIRPVVTINILISIIGTLKQYDLIVVLTNGGPGKATQTLAMYIFTMLIKGMGETQGYVAALSMMLFVLVLFFVGISQYLLRKREEEM